MVVLYPSNHELECSACGYTSTEAGKPLWFDDGDNLIRVTRNDDGELVQYGHLG